MEIKKIKKIIPIMKNVQSGTREEEMFVCSDNTEYYNEGQANFHQLQLNKKNNFDEIPGRFIDTNEIPDYFNNDNGYNKHYIKLIRNENDIESIRNWLGKNFYNEMKKEWIGQAILIRIVYTNDDSYVYYYTMNDLEDIQNDCVNKSSKLTNTMKWFKGA